MPELRLVLYIAFYLAVAYLVLLVPLVWLATRGEPDLRSYWDLAMKPVLLPLRFLLGPFGVDLKPHEDVQERLTDRSDQERRAPALNRSTSERFPSQKQAKQYLIDRIVSEAERQGVPLDEIERKMLYFSETDWTPPDLPELNAAFERDYDENAYEQKIARLVRSLQEASTREEQEAWDDAAIRLAEDGDHYLTVLISEPESAAPARRGLALWLPQLDRGAKRPPGDLRRLILVTLLIFSAIFVFFILFAKSR